MTTNNFNDGDIVTPNTDCIMPHYILFNIRYDVDGKISKADFFCLEDGGILYPDVNGLTLDSFRVVT